VVEYFEAAHLTSLEFGLLHNAAQNLQHNPKKNENAWCTKSRTPVTGCQTRSRVNHAHLEEKYLETQPMILAAASSGENSLDILQADVLK